MFDQFATKVKVTQVAEFCGSFLESAFSTIYGRPRSNLASAVPTVYDANTFGTVASGRPTAHRSEAIYVTNEQFCQLIGRMDRVMRAETDADGAP